MGFNSGEKNNNMEFLGFYTLIFPVIKMIGFMIKLKLHNTSINLPSLRQKIK